MISVSEFKIATGTVEYLSELRRIILRSLPKTWLILLREKKEDESCVLVGLGVNRTPLSPEERDEIKKLVVSLPAPPPHPTNLS
jgi:hypothetical protein